MEAEFKDKQPIINIQAPSKFDFDKSFKQKDLKINDSHIPEVKRAHKKKRPKKDFIKDNMRSVSARRDKV